MMFAVGLAALPGGYDEGAEGYWKRQQFEEENSARQALGNYFSSIQQSPQSDSLASRLISRGPPSTFPSMSGAPTALARETAAVNAGTWAPAPDYDVGVQIGGQIGQNPPPGGATMGGQPGAPLSDIIPGPPTGFSNPLTAGGQPQNLTGPIIPPGGAAGAAPAPPTGPAAAPPAIRMAQAAPQPGGGPVSRGTEGQGPPTWENLARSIAQANPGIKPQVLARAVQQALPLMQADSRLWYQVVQSELGAARLKAQYDLAGARQNAVTQLMNDFRRNNPNASPEEEAAYFRLIQGGPEKERIAAMRSQPKSPAAIALQKYIEEGEAAGTPRTAKELQDFTADPSFTRQERAIGARERLQTERLTAAGERQEKSIAAAGERTQAQITSREKLAGLNRDQKLELFNRSYEQKESQFREKAALAGQRLAQGAPQAEDVDSMAQAIAHYRINPATALSRLNAQARSAIIARVQEINPKWSQSDWKASFDGISRFTTGRQGDAARFLTVADDHLKTTSALAEMLTKATDVRGLRTLINYISKQMGHPEVTNFDTARHFVASEVTRAIVGGPGALGDRIAAEAPLDPNAAPAQIRGAIDTYRRLIRGQVAGLKAEFERIPGVGPNEWKERFGFSPESLGPQEAKPEGGIKFNWVTPPAAPGGGGAGSSPF